MKEGKITSDEWFFSGKHGLKGIGYGIRTGLILESLQQLGISYSPHNLSETILGISVLISVAGIGGCCGAFWGFRSVREKTREDLIQYEVGARLLLQDLKQLVNR